jgi:hypothetical protein
MPIGNVRPTSAIALGTNSAGPMPCMALKALSWIVVLLNPHIIDQTENQSHPNMKMRL